MGGSIARRRLRTLRKAVRLYRRGPGGSHRPGHWSLLGLTAGGRLASRHWPCQRRRSAVDAHDRESRRVAPGRRAIPLVAALTVVIAACSTATVPPSPSAASTQSPPPAVKSFNVPFESSDPAMVPGVLDVYSPANAGRWPVVVMFHGQPGARGDLAAQATRVAERGYVVFVPDWGDVAPGQTFDLTSQEGMTASDAQNACAVAFAESHAADHGGDPSTIIVFGHSGGAWAGANLAFARGSRPRAVSGVISGRWTHS
jgi:acetyl esterase/lipase